MKVITYLGFTLISILMQFCVMDFIQEKLQTNEKSLISNVTSNRKLFRDILQEYSNKPHALYYRTGINHLKEYKNITSTPKNYSNVTLENSVQTTTDTLSSTFEELYDESASAMDIKTTTDMFYTSTEMDNFTEFTLFEKKNSTITKPNKIPKKSFTKDRCDCNLLFKLCDINCCCDSDCSETEINLFINCNERALDGIQNDVCYPQFSFKTQTSNTFGNLFCIAKTNLPEKRDVNKNKYDQQMAIRTMDMTLKWQRTKERNNNIEFTKKLYGYGDPIWLLKKGSIIYLDVSSPVVSSYCTDRKIVKFLQEETIQCSVKLTHLEMIHILETVEESVIISVTESNLNASVLNCSNVHCTNWTVIICDDIACTTYNKSIHEPFCTDSKCTIAPKMDYIFYYHDLRIVNATIKMYIQNVSMTLPLMRQEISVRFFLANESIEQAVQFSGAPGYIPNHPIIVSYVKSNHTNHFFNSSSWTKHFILPVNQNGKCTASNTARNVLLFGPNTRTKCRFSFEPKLFSYNATYLCKIIHSNIQEYLGLNSSIYVSPYGNPYGQKDEEWLPLQVQNIEKETIYGEFLSEKSTLMCHNIVTDVFLIFTFADQSIPNDKVKNKILTAILQMTQRNATFNVEDFSIVLTVDTTFVDVTKPPVYEFAGSPDLNIHLPSDFFFPFPNRALINKGSFVRLLCICGAVFVKIK